ncbi:MAG: ATP-dependent endonuclease [Bacteroidetes bacterium]|jgi:exodeoxyribonuclease-5|nr:ATP-dependent endonuclease [Bacteroidota bacterium]
MYKRPTSSEFGSHVRGNLPFTPNADQEEAIKKISDFIFDPDERGVFVLKGYAGTGKTNLISAFTVSLPSIKWRSVLLAPTGRAAKVIGNYAKRPAQTIHKKIFRKQAGSDGSIYFSLAENLHRNTLFIVDEASMIGADSGSEGGLFMNLLENLFEYVYSGDNCKLILIGDTAQLPPVGSSESPALDLNYLRNAFHLNIRSFELKEVARQQSESGILLNATMLRELLTGEENTIPKLICTSDVVRLQGDELEDALNNSISRYGEEEVIIITRSNKRANLFNQSYRNRIKLYEENVCTGDRVMIVKNNYFWTGEKNPEISFIANGDIGEITRITGREELYGFNFINCQLRLIDYPNLAEQEVKLVIDCLHSDSPALTQEEQKRLYANVLEDVSAEPVKSIKSNYVRNSPYYNALQVKFSYAITCHKSQGGQWPVVFIDQGFIKEEDIDVNYLRWLYTAMTRATEKVFLINFNELFFN